MTPTAQSRGRRLRHPFVVSLALVVAAVAWLAGLFWIGVL